VYIRKAVVTVQKNVFSKHQDNWYFLSRNCAIGTRLFKQSSLPTLLIIETIYWNSGSFLSKSQCVCKWKETQLSTLQYSLNNIWSQTKQNSETILSNFWVFCFNVAIKQNRVRVPWKGLRVGISKFVHIVLFPCSVKIVNVPEVEYEDSSN